jgi:hypothetical protein
MPWIRIDDHYDEHPKLASVGPLGWAMWLAGLAYCNRNLTDGFIPWAIAGTLVSWDYLDATGPSRIYVGGRDTVSEEGAVSSEYVIMLLVEARVWDQVTGGYRVHDFDHYQPTKAVIMAERAKKVAAGTAGGIASATARAQAFALAPDVAKSKPVPNPVPVPVSNPDSGSVPLSTAREGLPNLDGEAIRALEERTGRTWSQAGQKQLSEYDELIESHGLTNVCVAMDSLREGQTMTARQLVWGAMKILEPMPSARVPANAPIEEKPRKPKVLEPWQEEFRAVVEAQNAKSRGSIEESA